jgi:hypothetical protein
MKTKEPHTMAQGPPCFRYINGRQNKARINKEKEEKVCFICISSFFLTLLLKTP